MINIFPSPQYTKRLSTEKISMTREIEQEEVAENIVLNEADIDDPEFYLELSDINTHTVTPGVMIEAEATPEATPEAMTVEGIETPCRRHNNVYVIYYLQNCGCIRRENAGITFDQPTAEYLSIQKM